MCRQTNRCIPLPQFFSVSYDLVTDSQEVKIATFLKTELFPLSRCIQSTTNRPQIQFHFFSITENSPLFINLYLCNKWMNQKKIIFLFGKFRIDRLTKRTDLCTCLIQNKSTSVGQWGGESSLQQTVLGSRATCIREMDLNTIHKTQFLIDFTSPWERLKNKASRENRGRFWWYWTRKKKF